MKVLGLSVLIDVIGNVIGVYYGEEMLLMVMMGLYIDIVVIGGLYDGNYGVMVGFEVIVIFQDVGICI